MKRTALKAVLTDSQFWAPVAVFMIGLLMLIYFH